MGLKVSLVDGKLYLDDSANYASPTWDLVSIVGDVTLDLTKAEANVNSRATPWELTVGTIKQATIEFKMLYDPADARYTQLLNAYLNDTIILGAVMDGPIATAGSQGLGAAFVVTKFTRNEPLTEAMQTDVTLKPTYFVNYFPRWLTISS